VQTVVLIEDEADIRDIVEYNFTKAGFRVWTFENGERALEHLRKTATDLVLLDIMLPGQDGLEICRRMRSEEGLKNLPLIFLTARGDEIDRIVGLELGADDYIVKPFSPRELVARAKAVLRRQAKSVPDAPLIAGESIRIDASTQDVVVRGKEVKLSALEFKLLHWLASHPRKVFSREQLLDHVWGFDRAVTPRTVDVHIRRLREKIEETPDHPDHIETVRGFGYRFRT
jgi:phosphate regulon transcriptional regulator PhoB